MKKILLTSILGLMATFGANAESSQGINACLYKLMNNSDVLFKLDMAAERYKSGIKTTDSAYEQFSGLFRRTIEDYKGEFRTFGEDMTEIVAAELLRECSEFIVPAINNDDLRVSLCYSSISGFRPASICYDPWDDETLYSTTITLWDVFDAIPGTFAYVVTNTNAQPGQQLSPNWGESTPWTNSCSAKHPALNIPDEAAANIAGQNAFGGYYDSTSEYFFDVPGGDVLAFPGMLLMDLAVSPGEQIVVATNLKEALRHGDAFAKEVAGSGACRNLKMHLISLPEALDRLADSNENRSGLTAMAGAGIETLGAGAAIHGAGLLSSGLGFSAIPGIGWIAAGVTIVTAGIAVLTIDSDIWDDEARQPVTVLKTWDL